MRAFDNEALDEEEAQRADTRYREFVQHQLETRLKKREHTRFRQMESATTRASSAAHTAEHLRQQTHLFITVSAALVLICVPLLAYWLTHSPIPAHTPDPHQTAFAATMELPVEVTNSVGMRLRLIPPGPFSIGSHRSAWGHTADEYLHPVSVEQPFYMASTEVTGAQYEQIMSTNPSFFNPGPDYPLESVLWEEAVQFCNALSRHEGLEEVYTKASRDWVMLRARNGYRLPVEIEWEYACRAGMMTTFYTGDVVDEKQASQLLRYAGWYRRNAGGRSHTVAGLQPNRWGLYDMLGNVQEWCWDWFDSYPVQKAHAFMGPAKGALRVIRGGGWYSSVEQCRSASRRGWNPDIRRNSLGFRVVFSPSALRARAVDSR